MDQVCIVCARSAENHPELKWTQMPPVRNLGERQPWVCTSCWDDLSRDLRTCVAELQDELEAKEKELKGALDLLAMLSPSGEIHP